MGLALGNHFSSVLEKCFFRSSGRGTSMGLALGKRVCNDLLTRFFVLIGAMIPAPFPHPLLRLCLVDAILFFGPVKRAKHRVMIARTIDHGAAFRAAPGRRLAVGDPNIR